MKIGRNMIIAIMITFCFTATLFMIIPIRSANSPYDPWIDYNDDGKISLQDLVSLANSYGTTGDPTKNVNVTNPRAMTIEENLTMSISPGIYGVGIGYGVTDMFATQGYDRMFVSAAITDASDHLAVLQGALGGAYWHSLMGDGSYTETFTDANYSYPSYQSVKGINFRGNTSYLPIQGDNSAEFAVKAPQCRLSFGVNSASFMNGWISIRISIYLTSGTTSPSPTVQNTYVTNWPSIQPQPSSATVWGYFNSSINSGYGSYSMPLITIGGYSRMFVTVIVIDDASYQGVSVQTTISLTSVQWNWGPSGYENVLPSVLNATYYGTYLPVFSYQVPPEFTTKNSECTLYFSITSEATSGWIAGAIKVYLRNE